jgi:hypothetical protein
MQRGMRFLVSTTFLPSFILATSFSGSFAHAKGIEEAVGIRERVQNFVGNPDAYRSLLTYQQMVGNTGRALNQPWSGSYWALHEGSVAFAYADKGGKSKRFQANLDHFESRMDRIQRRLGRDKLDESDIDELAPSEKYDLYLGDTNFTFTHAMWSSLAEQEKNSITKKIADWEGICHGWSAAASYSKRPLKKISVLSLDGKRTIPFYPHDLKALSSILWANSLIQDYTMVEGLRCKTNFPTRDYGSGKVLNTRCKGVNPGVWHLSLLGLMGEKKMPFIINKNNDIEIWNQPMSAYAFDYFNVNTGAKGKLEDAVLTLASTNDPFKAFRAKGTAYIVGVDMKADYISETDILTHIETDSPKEDTIETLHLRYDLELDAGFNVLGGEWISTEGYNAQGRYIPDYPGFMWRFKSDYPMANSVGDVLVGDSSTDYTLSKLLPASRLANQFRYDRYRINDEGDFDMLELDADGKPILSHHELRPQPLRKVVNTLVDLSQ